MKTWLTIAVVVMFGVLVITIRSFTYPHPNDYQIEDFDCLVQPDGITCGPTSVTMVLNRYGKSVSIEQVKAQTKTQWFRHDGKAVGMTSPEYLPIAMRHFGLSAKLRRGYANRLKHYVSSGKPCVVLLRSGELLWHYVVVVGYDQNSILVADPGSGHIEQLNNEVFEGSWSFKTDMRGEPMENEWIVEVLRSAEVYPRSMVVPGIHIDSP